MATRIPYIFATNGDTSTVPDETSTDELSWEDGWSDAYALDTDESGYRYIDRSEMNYLFNVLSANTKEWQEQVFPAYSDEISYPEGAVILYTDDVFYEATTTTTAASVPGVSDDWEEYTRSGELSALISANTTSIEANTSDIEDLSTANNDGTKSALNASGDAPIYACRAWVNFNGTETLSVNASGNVSSVTHNSTGDYTINFETEIEDANYAVFMTTTQPDSVSSTSYSCGIRTTTAASDPSTKTTSSVRVVIQTNNSVNVDLSDVSVSIFR